MFQSDIHNYTCTLSEDDLDKAKRELNEDPDTRPIEIQTLRERLLRYPGLMPRVDDAFLLRFLRPKKFDQEKTFELIINYYKIKMDNAELYTEMTPRHIRPLLESKLFCVLPNGGKNGETIVFFQAESWDPAMHPVEEMFKMDFILNYAITESEHAQVNGVRFINDLAGLNSSHVRASTPSMAQKFARLFQDAFPLRLKGVHFVNEPTLFDCIFVILKPFLKEKFSKRIHFHGDEYAGLQEFIDPEYLPQEYGGKLSSMCSKQFAQRVLENQTKYEEEAKFGFVSMTMKNESKKSVDAMENLSGTFKKLNVN